MKVIGITMPCINLWDRYTQPAIESVMAAIAEAKKHDIDSSLLLLDNGSTDKTKEEGPKYAEKHGSLFIYKRNDDRWNFQESVNFGWYKYFEQTDAQYVLTLNNDILLHPETLVRLVERYTKGDVSMVTAMNVRGDIPTEPIYSQLCAIDKTGVPESPHPDFSAFMINKDTYKTIGEMDELYAPAYFEDNDYHYRMKLANLTAVTYPPAVYYHYGSRTQNEALGEPLVTSPMFERNRTNFVKKWGGVPESETFTVPYNNPEFNIRSTRQNPYGTQ